MEDSKIENRASELQAVKAQLESVTEQVSKLEESDFILDLYVI